MKKNLLVYISLFSVFTLFAEDLIRNPADLDILWGRYLNNGDLKAITEIVHVLEWEDLFRQEINLFLSRNENGVAKSRLIELLKELGFELNTNNTELSGLINIGAISFLLLNNDNYSSIVKEIAGIVQSRRSTLEQMMILGAATWSLQSNCEQHIEVKEHLLSIYNDLNPSAQYTIDKLILQPALNCPPRRGYHN